MNNIWIDNSGYLCFHSEPLYVAFNPDGSAFDKGQWCADKIALARCLGILLKGKTVPTHANMNRLGFFHEGEKWIEKPVTSANVEVSDLEGNDISVLVDCGDPESGLGMSIDAEQPSVKPDDEAMVVMLAKSIQSNSAENTQLWDRLTELEQKPFLDGAFAALAKLRAQGALITPEEVKAAKRETVEALMKWLYHPEWTGREDMTNRAFKALNLQEDDPKGHDFGLEYPEFTADEIAKLRMEAENG